jgi:hypothetical protein
MRFVHVVLRPPPNASLWNRLAGEGASPDSARLREAVTTDAWTEVHAPREREARSSSLVSACFPGPASPHISPRAEMKRVSAPSARGAHRSDRHSCRSIAATRRRPIVSMKRNEALAGPSCASPVSPREMRARSLSHRKIRPHTVVVESVRGPKMWTKNRRFSFCGTDS